MMGDVNLSADADVPWEEAMDRADGEEYENRLEAEAAERKAARLASMTFTEEVIAGLRRRGWSIYKMEENGFEWWWNPEMHPPGTRGGVIGDEGRDWYWPFREAVSMALFEDDQAKRYAEPLIPKGTGKIITDEKHGEQEFDCALDVLRERIQDDYWYQDWFDPRDNPNNDPAMHWETRAKAIVAAEDEDAALAFLIERRGFEYERFYFEFPEPSPA